MKKKKKELNMNRIIQIMKKLNLMKYTKKKMKI